MDTHVIKHPLLCLLVIRLCQRAGTVPFVRVQTFLAPSSTKLVLRCWRVNSTPDCH